MPDHPLFPISVVTPEGPAFEGEAERALSEGFEEPADLARARAALQRALLHIRVAERRHREGPRQRA